MNPPRGRSYQRLKKARGRDARRECGLNRRAMPQVVTRFAPSPTGYLHVGGARTALFNWLLARHSGGKFLLRIEDTDLARSTQQACDQLLEDLRWLGLHWDNADLVYQSKRVDIYNRLIEDLIARGMAYKAYETGEELDRQRQIAQRAKRQYRYVRPKLTDEQVRQFARERGIGCGTIKSRPRTLPPPVDWTPSGSRNGCRKR